MDPDRHSCDLYPLHFRGLGLRRTERRRLGQPGHLRGPRQRRDDLDSRVRTLALVHGEQLRADVPAAADPEYRRNNESAKIKYVLYPASREAANVTVTPAEVQQYYTMHQAQYTHGEQRAAKYLIADYAKLRAQMNPTDAELRKIYEQR